MVQQSLEPPHGGKAAVAPSDQPSTSWPKTERKHSDVVCPTNDVIDGLLQSTDDIDIDENSTDDKPLLQNDSANVVAKLNSAASPPSRSRFLGFGYLLMASLAFMTVSGCVKYSSRYISSAEIYLWRSVIAWVLNYGLVRARHVNLEIRTEDRKALFIRAASGSLSICLQFYSMTKMAVTDSTVILFTSPVMTFLMGAWILKEPIDRVDFSCALLSYVGVFFVARPGFAFPNSGEHAMPFLATLAAFGAAFTLSVTLIATRKLQTMHVLSIMHYVGLASITLAGINMLMFKASFVPHAGFGVFAALFFSGAFSCLALLWMTRGFQLENAGIASALRYIDVVLAFVLDSTVLGVPVNGFSVLGGCIILAGAVVIVIRRVWLGKQ